MDDLTLEHINNYWSNYGLVFPYKKLEHKPEHIAKRVGYIRKSDNGMLAHDVTGRFTEKIYKIRGQQHKTNDRIPAKELLKQILQGVENPKLFETKYIEEKIVSPKDFKKAHTRKEVENNEIKLIPGLSQVVQKEYTLNNTHHSIDTIAEYKARTSVKHIDKQKLFTKTAQEQGYRESNKLMEEDTMNNSNKKSTD